MYAFCHLELLGEVVELLRCRITTRCWVGLYLRDCDLLVRERAAISAL